MPIIANTKIIRSKRKSLAVIVTPDATLIVRAPHFTPQFFINAFIKENEEWIQKQLARLKDRPFKNVKRYEDGEIFLFLGMNLEFKTGNYSEISVKDNKLLFPRGMLFRAQKQLTSWYRQKAKEIITKQLRDCAEIMKTSYGELTFSDTKSQWGSCSRENNMQFSWRLVMTPFMTMNYVIIHELAHTREKNHSREFWNMVERYIPSYRTQRKWLKKYGHTLIV